MNENNPYFQVFDIIDRDIKQDKEMISEFIELATKHYVKNGVDREDALYKIKLCFKDLSEEITTKVVRMINNEDKPSPKRVGHLLKIPEVAKILKISLPTLHEWVNEGKLTAYVIGKNRIRFKRDEILQYTSIQKAVSNA